MTGAFIRLGWPPCASPQCPHSLLCLLWLMMMTMSPRSWSSVSMTSYNGSSSDASPVYASRPSYLHTLGVQGQMVYLRWSSEIWKWTLWWHYNMSVLYFWWNNNNMMSALIGPCDLPWDDSVNNQPVITCHHCSRPYDGTGQNGFLTPDEDPRPYDGRGCSASYISCTFSVCHCPVWSPNGATRSRSKACNDHARHTYTVSV